MKAEIDPNFISDVEYAQLEKKADLKPKISTEKKRFFVTINKDGTSTIDKPEAIIDKVDLFPNGRGKFLKIVHGHTIPKIKPNRKVNPNRLCMTYIKGNPMDISLVAYRNKYKKTGLHFDVYLFAGNEKRRLSDNEFDDLLLSLAAIKKFVGKTIRGGGTSPRNDGKSALTYLVQNNSYKFVEFSARKDVNIFNDKYKRLYNKFIKTKKGDKKVSEEAIKSKINEKELLNEINAKRGYGKRKVV